MINHPRRDAARDANEPELIAIYQDMRVTYEACARFTNLHKNEIYQVQNPDDSI